MSGTDAQLAIAKERRKLLRETIMMGINRLVIDKGLVRSKVVFDIQSKSNVTKTDKAQDQKTRKTNTAYNYQSWWNKNNNFGITDENKKTSISISTNKGTQSDELKAQLTGEVEIQFKSDYFKLDNFASEVEDLGGGRSAEAAEE